MIVTIILSVTLSFIAGLGIAWLIFYQKYLKTKQEISAGGIVFKRLTTNNQPLWLITQHSQNLSWGFPKGLIGDTQKDEAMETAALREVKEEGGVEAHIVFPDPVTTHYSYQWKNSPHGGPEAKNLQVNKTVHYFLMEYVSGDPKNHDWEVKEAKFASTEEVLKTLTHENDKIAFKEILRIKKELEEKDLIIPR